MPGQTAAKKTSTKKAAPKQPAPIKAAAKQGFGIGLIRPMELELPSGETCLAIRPGAQGLIKAKLLDSLDQLTSLVQVEHIDANDPRKASETKVSIEELAKDPEKLDQGLAMIDRVICHVVKAPVVLMDLTEEEQAARVARGLPAVDPEAIYASYVDEEDKMFIVQWAVGGTSDLIQFREESAKLMGSLSAG
jgi:hypothetical protein